MSPSRRTVAVGAVELPKRLEALFGAVVLDEAEDAVGDDDDGDQDRVDGVAGPHGERRGGDQHPDEDAVELREEDPHR
ncbi:MAG: hypothetical protein U5K37_12875 [Natrialbaceae archaeon]|nr:hypothetical protein [Natrialbaceae archaeon]